MKRIKLKKLLKSTKAKILVGLVVVLLFSAGAWALTGDDKSPTSENNGNSNTSENQTADGPSPNLNPPTSEQRQATEDYKKSLAEGNSSPTPTTASGKKLVTPVITSTYGGEIRSYVSGVIEDGGTCTATASKSGASPVTDSSVGFADATYTGCPPIPLSLTGTGWSVVVSYNSATSEGKSSAFPVN